MTKASAILIRSRFRRGPGPDRICRFPRPSRFPRGRRGHSRCRRRSRRPKRWAHTARNSWGRIRPALEQAQRPERVPPWEPEQVPPWGREQVRLREREQVRLRGRVQVRPRERVAVPRSAQRKVLALDSQRGMAHLWASRRYLLSHRRRLRVRRWRFPLRLRSARRCRESPHTQRPRRTLRRGTPPRRSRRFCGKRSEPMTSALSRTNRGQCLNRPAHP
jgi:hypothetical protein